MNILISVHNMTCNGEEAMVIELVNCLKHQGENVFLHSMYIHNSPLSLISRLSSHIPRIITNSAQVIKAFIEDNQIDICHAHNLESAKLLSSAIHRIRNGSQVRLVSTLHGSIDDFGKELFQREMLNLKKSHPVDTWTYVADKNKFIFDTCYPDQLPNMIKIPNGISLNKRPSALVDEQVERTLKEKDPIILTVISRAVETKGWKESILIVKQLRNTYSLNAHLLLIGDGPEYRRLKANELDPFIHLLGFKNNPIDYLNVSTVSMFLTSFRYESFPLSILESMSVGVPVIATDIGDIRRLISADDKYPCGIICHDKYHVESIAREIAALVTSEHRYIAMRENAFKRVKDFDIESVARKYIDVYKQTITLGGLYDKN